jgi:hypothetical protein
MTSVTKDNKMADRYRHKVRGTTYRVLYEAAKASSIISALDEMTMVVYQSEEDGLVWVRPASEFFDGRFELVGHAQRALGDCTQAEIDAWIETIDSKNSRLLLMWRDRALAAEAALSAVTSMQDQAIEKTGGGAS